MDFLDYDTRLAAYAVIVNDRDEVLLALWNEGSEPSWSLPGGGVEYAEGVAEATVRELAEETGYDVELTGVLGVDTMLIAPEQRFRHPESGRPLKAVRVIHTARIVGGELRHEIDGTTDEARWIPLDEVHDLPHVSLVDAGLEFWRASRG
ncbi:NUDIX hydrolase [Alteromonas gracilis]